MTEFHEIDKYRLDQEWEQQPRLYREHAERLADAEQALSVAESTLKVTRADVELRVRKNPEKYGLEQSREAEIKAAVEIHPKVKAAGGDVIDKQHDVNMHKAAVRTLEHRKAALEELVRLFLADYFSRPTVEGDGGRTMRERKAERAFKRSRDGE